MNAKLNRLIKIKNFLRLQSSPSTITEIHEALKNRMHLDVSRKTIERDLLELAEIGEVGLEIGIPCRYRLVKPSEFEVTLKENEILEILQVLDPASELFFKLKKWVDF